MFYTTPLSIVPPVISFSVPDAPIMSSMSFDMAAWFLYAALALLRAFEDSHSLLVKSRTAATAVLF
jgi:hypothetical protein